MQAIIEIADNKSEDVLKYLNELSYVKINLLNDEKEATLLMLERSVIEFNKIQTGELPSFDAEEMINAL